MSPWSVLANGQTLNASTADAATTSDWYFAKCLGMHEWCVNAPTSQHHMHALFKKDKSILADGAHFAELVRYHRRRHFQSHSDLDRNCGSAKRVSKV